MKIINIIRETIESFDWAEDVKYTLGQLYDSGNLSVGDKLILRGNVFNGETHQKTYVNDFEVEVVSKTKYIKGLDGYGMSFSPERIDVIDAMGVTGTEEISFLKQDGDLEVVEHIKSNDRLNEEGEFDWVSQHLESIPDDPHYVALTECYGGQVLQGLEPKNWTHYGLTAYENEEGEEYAVGTIEECDDALKEYYDYLLDEVGTDGWNTNIIDPVDYMYMTNTDIRMWADDLASSNMDGMDVEDYIEQTSYSEKYEELLEKISDLESEINDIENQQIDMVDQDLEETEEYRELEDKLGELEDLLKDYGYQKDDMEYDAKQEQQYEAYLDYKRQLERDPIEFFIDMGIYSDANEMVENNVLSFNKEEFIEDLVDFGYYGEMGSYDGEYCRKNVGGEDYICLRLN